MDASWGEPPHGHTTVKTSRARCTATAKTTGKPCRRYPEQGAKTCHFHGSATRAARAKAAQNVAEEKARVQMARLGLPEPVKISHGEAMIWLVSAKYAEVCWLRAKVQSISEADLVWGVTRDKAGATTTNLETGEVTSAAPEVTRESRPNIWWVMLRGAEDQLVVYAKAAHAAGVDDAHVDLAKQQGQMLGAFLDGLMAAMFAALVGAGVTREDFPGVWAATIADLFPRHFRALGGVG